ncbi:HEAT repeat domain-containing protein [Synechococcus sp. PCC 7336]|uniref:HEAT repeat domain-containing protein n=1 Tax=Synechococcus sp. PCC 7336 TaxID=195250 RepID=UPI0005713C5C|nr:HEAT repeat domain-containing protein [Synechococcus sp. PCC 7336]
MSQHPTCAELIRAVDLADSADAMLDAVEALAEARLLEAIPTLIEVLSFNNPGAAVAAVDGLVLIGEPAVVPLLELMDGYNYTARSWAVRALAGIGDPRGLEILLHAATTDFSFSVRRAATRGLGFVQWSSISDGDRRLAAQAKALEALLLKARDEEWIVRYAAVVGLQRLAEVFSLARRQDDLAAEKAYLQQVQTCFDRLLLEDSQLAVKARAIFARQQLQQCSGFADRRHPNASSAPALQADPSND